MQKLSTLQGYIFLIFQHLATKHCSFTEYRILFQAVLKYLPSSTFFKIKGESPCSPYREITSNADARCYTKFNWLEQNVEPIKFHVTLSFSAFDVTMKIDYLLPNVKGVFTYRKTNVEVFRACCLNFGIEKALN